MFFCFTSLLADFAVLLVLLLHVLLFLLAFLFVLVSNFHFSFGFGLVGLLLFDDGDVVFVVCLFLSHFQHLLELGVRVLLLFTTLLVRIVTTYKKIEKYFKMKSK